MWQPSAEISVLHQRAKIIQSIRRFFDIRSLLEVETPTLSRYTVTDQHLASFATAFCGPGFAQGVPLYLQTSPEFAMKRLLAGGSGSIYQITKAYRNEESGRYHNPEFTMLEWYRVGFDHHDLMAEVDELLQLILGCAPADYLSYQAAFIKFVGIDPLIADIAELKSILCRQGMQDIASTQNDADTLLQLIFSTLVEPNIGLQRPCFIYHFPASQAALAKLSDVDPRIAERFEVYFKGIELANGFHELTDAHEQQARFEQDNQKRIAANTKTNTIDPLFIAALQHGLPACSGVAMGVDRLIMLATGCESIEQVLAFSLARA